MHLLDLISTNKRITYYSNNHSAINVEVDSIPEIIVICLPMDSFIVFILSSDNFTIISYGPSSLLTSITQGNCSADP
jgi:hypothetical protein